MRDVVPEIRARGAELVVVGNGQPEHARDFRERQALDFPLYVDPDLEAYAAAGLRRGVSTMFRPGLVANTARALKGGFRQGKTQGDPWQHGGVFVIHPPADPRFSYISKTAGDHPAPAQFLAAL